MLNKRLDDINVIRQAYHGNVFVGIHCKIVLANYENLCNVIADRPINKVRTVFSIFSRISPILFRKSRFLSQEEIAT